MKIILQSQLSDLPAYLSEEEKTDYTADLTSLGFTIDLDNNSILPNCGEYYPQLEVEYDSLDLFLESVTRYWRVSYGGEKDNNGSMIWTLLNDPYPC